MSNELLIPLDNIDREDNIEIRDNIEIDKTHYRRFIFTTILSTIISLSYSFIGYFYIPIYHISILLFTYFIKHNDEKYIDIFLLTNIIITVLDFIFIFLISPHMFNYIISITVFTIQFISLVTIHNYKMKLVN